MTIFRDKSILITGGTGSFGTKFVELVLKEHQPRKLIVFSRDEFKHYTMESRIRDPRVRYFIGDVRDLQRLQLAMREVDIVVHAAAMKHVPLAEYNPMECVRTNILGAENVVRAALDCRVPRVIALSTDKAASPVNLYGATKLASDKIFIASNALSGNIGTKFAVVRYGNVVGSRGSVVPFFLELLAKGADHLPITDARMTRFWITLEQGVRFVIASLEAMAGGELYVPKLPSMRITDLAEVLAPGKPHKIVGIRPGEKLHEVMITEDDARMTVELPDRYIICPALDFWQGRAASHGGKPVAEGFRYASDTNTDWLNGARLKAMLAAA